MWNYTVNVDIVIGDTVIYKDYLFSIAQKNRPHTIGTVV